MAVPKSVVRIVKGDVKYISNVDRASYTILELTRAALRDVGRFVIWRANNEAMKLRGMISKNVKGSATFTGPNKRVKGTTSAFLYNVPWAKKGLPHLEVGITDDAWYGVEQELGSSKMPKLGILRNTAHENIAKIVEIESKYLSALEDEAEALRLISEEEYTGGGEDI